jgi:hypothetical protein
VNGVQARRPSFRAPSRPEGMTTTTDVRFTRDGRTASLALLRARLRRLPGVAVAEHDGRAARDGAARLLVDVAGTGLSGYELGRRMRAFSGVPLELCRERHLVVVIGPDEDLAACGERLLFALGHACVQGAAVAA